MTLRGARDNEACAKTHDNGKRQKPTKKQKNKAKHRKAPPLTPSE